jgi:isopenicillin N synthase-like dioxygenase
MFMAYSAFKSIPVIDVSGLYSDTLSDRLATASEIGTAARSAGFFYVIGHPISRVKRARLFETAQRFFSRDAESKMKFYIGNSINHTGYVPPGEEMFSGQRPDRKEAYDVCRDVPKDHPDVLSGKAPMLGPVQWPADVEFQNSVGDYYRLVSSFARVLFRGFALALELEENFFEKHLTCTPSQLRLIHYPFAPDAPVDEPGIGAHTDYECFTILLLTAPGLEVLNSAGEWINAPPVADAFIINIGDMLEAWTNGSFIATSHRVRKVQEERYAFPYFANVDYDTVVAPLTQFVTADQPSKYQPIVAGDHLLAQVAQTFAYIKKRISDGTFKLPDRSLALSSFGQEARNRRVV